MRSILFLFPLLILVVKCDSKKEGVAPDVNFYYSVQFPDLDSVKIHADYISEQIPLHKYAITNASGYSWPFYQEFSLDETVMSDSLMPPHWFIHKMKPIKGARYKIKEGEYHVVIDLYPQLDTLPNYNVKIYQMEGDSLRLSANTGIHYILSNEYHSNEELSSLLLESIIRYSFK